MKLKSRRAITHIIFHTAAAGKTRPVDQSANVIRSYHVNHNGWNDIGYHFVIRFDGTVEKGRNIDIPGAHVKFFNSKTIGICVTGHGNLADFTDNQKTALVDLCIELMKSNNLLETFKKNAMRVAGHREVMLFGAPNPFKSCPGTKVDCREIRRLIQAEVKRRGL